MDEREFEADLDALFEDRVPVGRAYQFVNLLSEFDSVLSHAARYNVQNIKDMLRDRDDLSGLNLHQEYILIKNLDEFLHRLMIRVDAELTRMEFAENQEIVLSEGQGDNTSGNLALKRTARATAVRSEKGLRYRTDVGMYINDYDKCIASARAEGERIKFVFCYFIILAALTTALRKLIPFTRSAA